MKITAEPRSDQWNADDFVSGPKTFTIAGVKPGSAEQKYDVELVEGEGRVWRPPLTMIRLLMAAWGDEASVWQGRRVTLHRDESVRFGPDAVGGIRVSHMSDLPGGKPFEVKLTDRRGHRSLVHAKPIPESEMRVMDLRAEWKEADTERKKAIEAEVNALSQSAADPALVEAAFPEQS